MSVYSEGSASVYRQKNKPSVIFTAQCDGGVEGVTETLKFSKTTGKPLSITWLTKRITALYQTQLSGVSAEPSVSATGVYGPRGLK